jgi:hypothetical protein
MEECYLTVKQLRDFLNNCDLPDDTKVYTQRLEDRYVEKHGWTPLLKEGEHYHNFKKWNEYVDNYDNLPEDEQLGTKPTWKYTEEQLNRLKEQYIKIWGICQYKEKDGLFLNVHY